MSSLLVKMSQKELEQLINNIKDFAISKNPSLALKTKENELNSIINHSLKHICDSGNEKGLTLDKANNPSIMQELAKKITSSISISKTLSESPPFKELDKALNKLLDDKEFKAKFEKISKSNKPDKDKFNELKKLLDEHINKNPALKNILELSKKLLKELRAALPRKKSSDKELDKKAEPSDVDVYSNLFGLINSRIAGGLQIPLVVYIGNGFGFNDWNPNDGSAPIDYINSLDDNQFGDSYGFNAQTARNYLSIPETSVDGFEGLRQSLNEPDDATPEYKSPSPFNTTPGKPHP